MSPPEPEALDGTDAMRVLRLVDALPHLVGIADDQGSVVWMNRSGRTFVGATDDQLPDLVEVFGTDIVERYRAELRPALRRGQSWCGLLPVNRPDGTIATVDAVVVGELTPDGEIDWIAMLAVDVTAQRQREAELAHRASHDPLTGLPNRALLEDRLGMTLAVAGRTGAPVAVVALDLDGFKDVNDDHGHAAGDLVLQQATARLLAAVRPADTVARLGGDEFVVVVHPPETPQAAVLVAERIRERLAEPPYQLDGTAVSLSSSIGVAIAHPPDAIEAGPLLVAADRAMYEAKRAGGDCVRLSETAGGPDLERYEDVGRRLSHALRAGRISARFDPIVGMTGTSVQSFSIEPHWDRPGRESVPARYFLEDAAATGQADAVRWAASRRAVRTARELGLRVPVDIPVSGSQLRDPGFAARFDALRRIGPNIHVRLEVEESRLVDLPSVVLRVVDELGPDTTEVVLSGHGTAGAPLALLAELPVAVMKLAPSLTAALPTTHHAVRLAVQLAVARGVPCVGTGVDHPDQRAMLADLGVDVVQGAVTGGPWDAARLASDTEVTRPRP